MTQEPVDVGAFVQVYSEVTKLLGKTSSLPDHCFGFARTSAIQRPTTHVLYKSVFISFTCDRAK